MIAWPSALWTARLPVTGLTLKQCRALKLILTSRDSPLNGGFGLTNEGLQEERRGLPLLRYAPFFCVAAEENALIVRQFLPFQLYIVHFGPQMDYVA